MPESCPDMAVDGDQLGVHYTVSASNEHNTQGYLYSNGKKFDSSLDRHRIFPVTLGEGRVIKGWEKGLWGMCVECVLPTHFTIREKRRLIIPAGMAYGNTGAGDLIPPGATLVFDVELIGIRGKGKYANKCSVCLNKPDTHPRQLHRGKDINQGVHNRASRLASIRHWQLPNDLAHPQGSLRRGQRIHRSDDDHLLIAHDQLLGASVAFQVGRVHALQQGAIFLAGGRELRIILSNAFRTLYTL